MGNTFAMVQVTLSVGVPTLAVLVGVLLNNSRLGDLRSYMESRFQGVDRQFQGVDRQFQAVDRRMDDLKAVLQADMHRIEEVMDARLTRIEQELKIR